MDEANAETKSEIELQSESLHKKSKLKKKKKEKPPEFEKISGVHKMVMSVATQEQLGCVAGKDITGEDPWKYVSKGHFEDEVDAQENKSLLVNIKKDLTSLDAKQILIGYVADETTDNDEFYVCLTKDAESTVAEIIDRLKIEHDEKMNNALVKVSRPWLNLGSDEDVDGQLLLRNRPLLIFEVESKYPFLNGKCRFKLKPADPKTRSYIEMSHIRCIMEGVYKKKIDTYVQAAPLCLDREAQTICTYPKNKWTQYVYEYKTDEQPNDYFANTFRDFVENEMEAIYDQLDVNGHINLYMKDYETLIKDEKLTRCYSVLQMQELTSFTDITQKDKMISSIAWHPNYVGVFAATYSDAPNNTAIEGFELFDINEKIIHKKYPVILWSFLEVLRPKLILDSQSEVTSVSFCPYEDGLVIGGCKNGQVILWDLRDEIQALEKESQITQKQERYRRLMFSTMGWIQFLKYVKIIKPTMVTSIKYSHLDQVTQVEWLSPFYDISDTGHSTKVNIDSKGNSLQFISSSLDGHLLVWDIRASPKPEISVQSSDKLKRIKQKPDGIVENCSPFKALNKILRPVYDIEIKIPYGKILRNMPISSISMNHFKIEYIKMEKESYNKNNFVSRARFLTKFDNLEEINQQSFCVGTSNGYFISGHWKGFIDEDGLTEPINYEVATLDNVANYHDGPIVNLCRWAKFPEYLLSVGGKVFCIWKETLKNRPILWRRNRVTYTNGIWCPDVPIFHLTRADGNLEIWSFSFQSKELIQEHVISGKQITGSYMQSINNKVLGVSDYNGSFRIFKANNITDVSDISAKLHEFLESQTNIVSNFVNWQEKYTQKELEKKKISEEEMKKLETIKKEEDRKRRLKILQQQNEAFERGEEEEEGKVKKRPPPDVVYQKKLTEWREKEKIRLNKVLLQLKKLDPVLLRELQEPSKEAEKAEVKKQRKKKQTLRQATNIFKTSVKTNFPKVLEDPPSPPKDPYKSTHSLKDKQAVMENYRDISKQMDAFIKQNSFEQPFNWLRIQKEGEERGKALTVPYGTKTHMERHELYKQERKRKEETKHVKEKPIGKKVWKAKAKTVKTMSEAEKDYLKYI